MDDDDQEPMIVSLLTDTAKENSFKLHRLKETNHTNQLKGNSFKLPHEIKEIETTKFKSSSIFPELKQEIKEVLH